MKGLIYLGRIMAALLYTAFFSIVVMFLMKYIEYLVLSNGWIGDVLFLILSGTVVASFLAVIIGLLSIPLLKLVRNSRLAKTLCSIIIVVNGCIILGKIWKVAHQCGMAEIIGAILCSLFIFHLYKSFIENIWLIGKRRGKVWDD